MPCKNCQCQSKKKIINIDWGAIGYLSLFAGTLIGMVTILMLISKYIQYGHL